MDKSRRTFPSAFGENIRSIENFSDYKAAEWSNWTMIFAPIYLKGALPEENYQEFTSLVTAMTESCDYTNTKAERFDVRIRFAKFLAYYEKRFYCFKWDRLPAMRPVSHHLAHVADSLESGGPGWVYWQFPMER
ncbi:hypothetical protein DFP73DRAFT_488013, partial [Morchella snyderi]